MISNQQIQYILQLAETKSFSKAADLCFVTQPTLSMQVKKAEEILGFSIFDRDKQPLSLTPLGKELIPALREINEANNAVINLSKKAGGTYMEELSVGIIPTISPYLIPMFYKQWKRELKHTRLIIKENNTEDILNLLEKRKIDFAIIAGPLSDPKWKTDELYIEELLAYSLDEGQEVLKTKTLSDKKPWLLNSGNCLRSQMMQFCKINDFSNSDWNFEGGNIELLIKMVDMNGGYTLVPDNYKPLIKNMKGNFHPIKDSATGFSPARSIIGLQAQRNTKSNTIQHLINSIRLELRTKPAKNTDILNWK